MVYNRIIVLFAGERIFEIAIHMEKIQAKWLTASHALFAMTVLLKGADITDNLSMTDKSVINCCYLKKRVILTIVSTNTKML